MNRRYVTAAEMNLFITQGADFDLPLRWRTKENEVVGVDNTNWEMTIYVETHAGISVTTIDGVADSDYWMNFNLTAVETSALEVGEYWYALDLVYTNQEPVRTWHLLEGKLIVNRGRNDD